MLEIKLVWSSWPQEDSEYYKTELFDNIFYQKLDEYGEIFNGRRQLEKGILLENNKYKNKNNLPFWNVAQDNLHPGSHYHEVKSNEFFNEVIARYENT